MSKPSEILREVFGYYEFKKPQEEIINSILSGRDTLAILPTGAGKSLCYQIPSLIFDGITIVISPLISLMKDQVHQLQNKIKAEYLNSALSFEEQQKIYYKLLKREIKLLYISPEKFTSDKFINTLKEIKVSHFAIDEAHCISEWGHDFRPSYLKLKNVLTLFPDAVISAFTATATPEVKEDIIYRLGLRDVNIFISGFERENIKITITRTKNKKRKLFQILRDINEPTIIYCQSRKEVEDVNNFLKEKKINSLPYHAGMDMLSRKTAQEFFQDDKIKIIVATNAFGMGINKSNIRNVIHYSVPGTIENYYQEIGRAGRDGKESEAILLYTNTNDKQIHEYFINQAKVDRELVYLFYEKLNNFYNIKIGEINSNLFKIDNANLSGILNFNISQAQLNIILSLLEKNDILRVNYFNNIVTLKLNFEISDLKFLSSLVTSEEYSFLNHIVRSYGNYAAKNYVTLKLDDLAKNTGISKNDISEIIASLKNKDIIEINKNFSGDTFQFIKPRVYSEELDLDFTELNYRHSFNLNKLFIMHKFITTKECRWNFILNYFEERGLTNYRCMKCDNCQSSKIRIESSDLNLEKDILSTIKQSNEEFGINTICDILVGSKSKKIISNDLNKVSTYGFYRGVSKDTIKEKINKLIVEEKLIKSADFYPKLLLSNEAKELTKDIQPIERASTIIPEEEPVVLDDLQENLGLYDRLIKVRLHLAKKYNQPVEFICSDNLIKELTMYAPKTKSELMNLKGVNEKFLIKSAEFFLDEINNFLEEKKIKKVENGVLALPESIRITYQMIKEGNTFFEICEKRNLSDTIISEHIVSLINNSLMFDLEKLISLENIVLIKKAFSELNTDSLIVLKQKLPDHISYGEIRICINYWKKLQNKT